MISNVEHPSHYMWLKQKCGIEVIDITRHLDFDIGNAIKYLLRSGYKHDASMTDKEKAIEDLEKAIFYINDKINLLKDGNCYTGSLFLDLWGTHEKVQTTER